MFIRSLVIALQILPCAGSDSILVEFFVQIFHNDKKEGQVNQRYYILNLL